MDAPDLDPADHRQALRALSRVHALSGTGRRLRTALDDIADTVPSSRPIRMLDAACGGGDAVLDAARWAERRGRALRVVGLDLSETALEVAGDRVRTADLDGSLVAIDWVLGDALGALPEGPFDLVSSSLFLHHLSDDDVVSFLSACRDRTASIRMEDLRRTRTGHLLAWLTLRAVSRSRVAHVDGPRSVRAAWRSGELLRLATDAGLEECRTRRVWPQRLLLAWDRT